MPNDFNEYLNLLLDAIVEGRIEAKTLRDMTPEQREEYRIRLKADERAAIDSGLARHETPSPSPAPQPNGEDAQIKE